MMSHEIDGLGNVKIFTFSYGDIKKRFTDYATGWDWARKIKRDCPDDDITIGWDYEWIQEKDVERYIEEIEEC